MVKSHWAQVLVVIGLLAVKKALASERKGRQGGFLNVFQVISFPNGSCQGSGNQNGTCYTEAECNSRGGSNGGSCAAGFGVCCIITVTCGATSSENCTYFDSSGLTGITDGCCTAEICPCGDHICQLRLDFDTFSITGPSTATNSVTARRKNGGDVTYLVDEEASIQLTTFGQCLTDSFSVSNPDGPNPPTICGINTGEHMYVEASDCCNKLSFALGENAAPGVSMIGTRSWSIKVTQYSCKFQNLAPQGCTQYFFDGASDNVQTYNYNNGNGVHLANQDQQICIRICWTAVVDTDFAVSGTLCNFVAAKIRKKTCDPGGTALNSQANFCCDYGVGSADTKLGFDCVQIPGANNVNDFMNVASVYCGNNMGLADTGTICSVRTPFALNFRSDKWEPLEEAKMGGQETNRGFTLMYTMDAIGCNPAGITG